MPFVAHINPHHIHSALTRSIASPIAPHPFRCIIYCDTVLWPRWEVERAEAEEERQAQEASPALAAAVRERPGGVQAAAAMVLTGTGAAALTHGAAGASAAFKLASTGTGTDTVAWASDEAPPETPAAALLTAFLKALRHGYGLTAHAVVKAPS